MGRPEGSGCYCFPNALLTECIETLERGYRLVIVDSERGMEHIAGDRQSPDILLITSDPGARDADRQPHPEPRGGARALAGPGLPRHQPGP